MTPADIAKARAVCEALPAAWLPQDGALYAFMATTSRWERIVQFCEPDAEALAEGMAGVLCGHPAALDALEQSRAREAQVEKELREAIHHLRALLSEEDHSPTIADIDAADEFVSRFDEEADRG